MFRCSVGAANTVAPAEDRLGQGQLPDVVHLRRVLQVEQLGVAHAELLADGQGQGRHPVGVPRLG